MLSLQATLHYFNHFGMPVILAYLLFRPNWKLAALVFLSAIWIDVDHLLASPIFDTNRCSINFHPLHSYYAIAVYCLMLFPPRTRLFAIGLLLHIGTDYLDCMMMS